MAVKKKKTTAKQKKGKQQTVDTSMKNEFISLFIIVAGLLLGALLYAPSGVVGEWVENLCTGLLGLPAYLLPVLVLAYGIHRAIGKGFEQNKHKYTLIAIGILVLSAVFHLFSEVAGSNPFTELAMYWHCGIIYASGGVLGGFLCDIIASGAGKAVAGIILFTAIIVLVMILTKWSPLKALLRVIVRMFVDVKAVQKKAAEEASHNI